MGGAGLWVNRGPAATAGYAVAPPFRGQGYATAALVALTDFAWTRPGLARVELYIEPANLASVAVARRCGYAEAGLVPEHTAIDGVRRDMLRSWLSPRGAGSEVDLLSPDALAPGYRRVWSAS